MMASVDDAVCQLAGSGRPTRGGVDHRAADDEAIQQSIQLPCLRRVANAESPKPAAGGIVGAAAR